MTWDPAATIVAVTGLVTALGALYFTWRNSRSATLAREAATAAALRAAKVADDAKIAAEAGKAEIVEVHGELRKLGEAVDGRLTQLITAIKAASLAAGIIEGRAAQKADNAASPGPAAVAKANGALEQAAKETDDHIQSRKK